MKNFLFLTLALTLSFNAMAEKYAIIIAVGDYPKSTGWSSISSVNDVPLIKNTLISQDFKEENIVVLKNEIATRSGIIHAIEALQKKVKLGDIVVIHYSGHGQQIFDDNDEEIDNLDEAIVPYDALVRYTSNYKGENHIRDDEMGNIFTNFRNRLGKDGQLLVLLDSCHSGSATRGGIARGGEAAFIPPNWETEANRNTTNSGMVERAIVSNDAAPFIFISGASADELNYEYEGYGSLSFSFYKAMSELGSDVTYKKLFTAIASNMNVITPNQNPTIEGDVNYKLFNGEYVKQQSYFEVTKISNPQNIEINAGKLKQIFEGSTVNILPAGSTKVEGKDIIAKGVVKRSYFSSSIIELDMPLQSKNEKEFWVFIDQPNYGDIKLDVYFDKSLKSKDTKKAIKTFLENNKIGKVVKDALDASVIISEEGNKLIINTINGKGEIYKQEKIGGSYDNDSFTNALFNYAQGSYLKNLSLKNLKYEFEFRLLPVEKVSDREFEALDENAYTDEAGKFKVNATDDAVLLEVTNKSKKSLYFSIIEINSQGEIFPFMPNTNCTLNDNERFLPPGKTMVFKDCIFSFGPPYETLILKGFATENPVNFQPTVRSRGQSNTRGDKNPLERFISKTYSKTRGSTSQEVGDSIDGFTTEFVYEIVKEK